MNASRRVFEAFERGGAIAALVALAACPPTLTGEKCDSDCACPDGQTCVFEPSLTGNAMPGTCQEGKNHCPGGLPDSGTPDSGIPDSGIPDSGSPDSGPTAAFAGQVTLNGGAAPTNPVQVYGYASGNPVSPSGIYVNADLAQAFGDGGRFAFSGPVPSPYDGGYRFAAVYNTRGNGDVDSSDPGILAGLSATNLIPGSSNGLTMRIDVQTSTCYSLTVYAQQLLDQTYLLGIGALVYDIHTGALLDQASDLSMATAVYDAGSPLPSDFGQLGTMTLQPSGSVPDLVIGDSWIYLPDSGVAPVSDEGTFFFTLNDAMSASPQYPNGSCQVAYGRPPGSPSSLEINDGGMTWGGFSASSSKNTVVSWQDSGGILPTGFSFVADFISINDSGGKVLFNNGGLPAKPPLSVATSVVPVGSCGFSSGCTLRVTSLYADERKEHSTAYEGGMTVLSFQRTGTGPGG